MSASPLQKSTWLCFILAASLVYPLHSEIHYRYLEEELSPPALASITPILKSMEKFHRTHLALPRDLHLPLRLFSDQASYRRHQRQRSTTTSSWGYYCGFSREIVTHSHERVLPTIIHETQHYLMRLAYRYPPPLWLTEGLSEFYEHAIWQEDSAKILFPNTDHRKQHCLSELERLSNTNTLTSITLEKFLHQSAAEWKTLHHTSPNTPYHIALQWTHWMMRDSKSRKHFSSFIKLQSLGNQESISRNLTRAFKVEPSQLCQEFLTWLHTPAKDLSVPK